MENNCDGEAGTWLEPEEGESDVAKWMKNVVSKRRLGHDLTEVSSYLKSLPPAQARATVLQQNQGGKALLHFVSQFRGGDPDGLELIELLMALRADPSAPTRNGHTPLFFAAARGHSAAVRLLLDHGANPCVVTVCGYVPTAIGKDTLDAETQARLEAAEVARPAAAWQDFRKSDDAPFAKEDQEEQMMIEQAMQAEAIEQGLTAEVSSALCKGVSDGHSEELIRLAIRAGLAKDRDLFQRSLQHAFREVLGRTGFPGWIEIFCICQEELMTSVLKHLGHRDRRPIQWILQALVDSVRSCDPLQLSDVSAADFLNDVDPVMAFELLLVQDNWSAIGVEQLDNLWERLAQMDQSSDCPSDLVTVSCISLPKRQGGIMVSQWLQFLRLANYARKDTHARRDIVSVVARRAVAKQLEHQLCNAVAAGFVDLLPEISEVLSFAIAEAKQAAATYPNRPPLTNSKGDSLPMYKLRTDWELVTGAGGIERMHACLRDMSMGVALGKSLLVGIDTEWGHESQLSQSTIAVLQVATLQHVWVVDCLKPEEPLRLFVKWLLESSKISILGFSFLGDAEKLATLVTKTASNSCETVAVAKQWCNKVMDVQDLARRGKPLGQIPSLKAVAERWLGVTLDKTLQCSEWGKRPLSDAQMSYAAADAAVLLDIAGAMGLEQATLAGEWSGFIDSPNSGA